LEEVRVSVLARRGLGKEMDKSLAGLECSKLTLDIEMEAPENPGNWPFTI